MYNFTICNHNLQNIILIVNEILNTHLLVLLNFQIKFSTFEIV